MSRGTRTSTESRATEDTLRDVATALESGGDLEVAVAAVETAVAAVETDVEAVDVSVQAVDTSVQAVNTTLGTPAQAGEVETATDLTARLWTVTATDDTVAGGWETVALTVGDDEIEPSLLTIRISAIGLLTRLDWYLSWDLAGDEPITGRYQWSVGAADTDELQAGKSGAYVGAARLDVVTQRPAGIGTADTVYLHHYGTGAAVTFSATLSGRK